MRFDGAAQLIGVSPVVTDLRQEIDRVARTDAKVLITGESGTGKEVVARQVYALSNRAGRPFVAVNCAGMPETLLESELFGHVRGSFTGAYRDKPGKLEVADEGTIFLDEIGEMTLRMQGLLLRFLETGEIQKVGADRTGSRVDVRTIAATNRDLREMIAQGLFREDLFYRLNVIHLIVPPLRERKEDIPALVEHFVTRMGEPGRPAHGEDHHPEAMALLAQYNWPGNVRELQNVIERMMVRSRNDVIGVDDVPNEVRVTLKTVDAVPRAPPHHRRRALRADYEREPVVLDHGLPAVHAAGDHARRRARGRPPRAAGCARQLQDRGAQVQHGKRRLQAVPQLPAQASLPAVVQGIPMTRTLPFLTAALALSSAPRPGPAGAQGRRRPADAVAPAAIAAAGVPVCAPDYVIGPDDVLSILFWRDKDLSAPK